MGTKDLICKIKSVIINPKIIKKKYLEKLKNKIYSIAILQKIYPKKNKIIIVKKIN